MGLQDLKRNVAETLFLTTLLTTLILATPEAEAASRYEKKMEAASVSFNKTNDLDAALKDYLEIQDRYDDEPRPAYNIARIYELKEDWVKAAQWFKKYLSLSQLSNDAMQQIQSKIEQLNALAEIDRDPKNKIQRQYATALLNARDFYVEGDFNSAFQEVEYAYRLAPDRPDAYGLAAMILISEGECDKAMGFIEKGLALSTDEQERTSLLDAKTSCERRDSYLLRLNQAKSAFQQKDYAVAGDLYLQLGNDFPSDTDSLMAASLAYALIQDYQKSAEVLQQITESDDEEAAAKAETKLQQLRPFLTPAVANAKPDPNSKVNEQAATLLARGEALLNQGDANAAEAVISDAIDQLGMGEDGAAFFVQRAKARFKNGKDSNAIADLTMAKLLMPANSAVYLALGDHFNDKKSYSEAISYLSQGLENVPASDAQTQALLFERGTTFYNNDQFELAIEDFEAALASGYKKINTSLLHHWTGDSYAKVNNTEKAKQHLKKSIALSAGESNQNDLKRLNQKVYALMHKDNSVGGQSYRWSNDFDREWVEEKLSQGYSVTSASYGSNGWAVVATKTDYISSQSYQMSEQFPKDFIESKWDDGFDFQHAAYGKGGWLVVMSKTSMSGQKWMTRSTFPFDEIQPLYDEGYYITELAYGDGSWLLVFSKNTRFNSQTVMYQNDYPESDILEKMKEGYVITDFSYDKGKWAVILSKAAHLSGQRLHHNNQLSGNGLSGLRSEIKESWDDSYELSFLEQMTVE